MNKDEALAAELVRLRLDQMANFKDQYGFLPHEERCVCGWRRADHTVWNTDQAFHCTSDNFRGTGKRD
jgi:hypothetical protein